MCNKYDLYFFILCSKTLNFIKKEVACKDMSNDKIESSSWALTSEATWRSELVAFFFADLWLSYNVSAVSILFYLC